MRELKVGDKVKVIDNDRFDDCNYAREGVIIDIDYQYVHSVLIRFKDGTTDCGTPGDLELITVKEYLIEDVIKLMRENPERKFKPLNGCESYIYFDVLNDSIKWGEGHFRTLSEVSILWTEYFPEESIAPLSFSEIVEIISKYGNEYKIEVSTANNKYKDFLSNVLRQMADKEESQNMSKYMKNGKWYLIDKKSDNRINYKGEC